MPPPLNLSSVLPASPVSGMASPALAQPNMQAGPESQTLMASPLADRIGGAVQAQQQQNRMAQIAEMVRMGLRMLSSGVTTNDPRSAAKLEKFAADLLTMFTKKPVPQTPQAMRQMAGGLNMPPSPGPGFPPPAVPGTNMLPPMGGSPLM